MKENLIEQAINSAKCRIYKLSFDLNGDISAHHQKKAENQKELMDVTIEALEKQLPKKAVDIEGVYVCRSCKRIVHKVYNYCENCGQRIDWRDVRWER